ncbi:putative transmembrane protein [Senna tora]|uniref:Putative transmembrane protein n=1 Tax=Senna tora TaxID=362788 RepID=A0A834WCS5_9FABA|nr:putative transmembrane protein [Senna tora]
MVGGRRRSVIAGLGFLMLMGTAVYFRLWAIDYNISSDDTELLRRQFDLANREAMDESAEWRLRYDEEVDKARKCFEELQAIKDSSQELENASSVNQKFAMLQKENAVLLAKVETLKRELEVEKLKCQA